MKLSTFGRAGTIAMAAFMLGAIHGCDSDEGTVPPQNAEAGVDAAVVKDAGAIDAAQLGDAGVVRTDPEVAAVLNAADQGEVTVAQVVVSKATTVSVKTFAQQMVDDHSLALSRRQTLLQTLQITPVDNLTASNLTTLANQSSAQLQTLSGLPLEITYMNNQVVTHGTVIQIIDTQLLPIVQNPAVRTEITTTRATVEAHYMLAKQILAELLGDGGLDAGVPDVVAPAAEAGAPDAGPDVSAPVVDAGVPDAEAGLPVLDAGMDVAADTALLEGAVEAAADATVE